MDEVWLRRALDEALKGKGLTAPNPAVGAVLVKDGRLIGEGFHARAGEPHAEVNAVRTARESVVGSTLYLTLEPCCHFGKTPPCTNLILEQKIARVVYAHPDPNPVVDGKGREKLIAAGVTCEQRTIPEVESFYESYDRWTLQKLPTVSAKLAVTLDGKTAGAHNEKLAITGDVANRWVHEQRKYSDAILTTWKTVLHDDPKLNARLEGEIHSKRVYVLDSRLRTPEDAVLTRTARSLHFLASAKTASTSLVDRWRSRGAEVSLCEGEQWEWKSAWEKIGRDGVHDLWVEVGGSTFEPLVKGHEVHRAYLFVAPFWLGESGLSAFQGSFPDLVAEAKSFQWHNKGRDVLLEVLW